MIKKIDKIILFILEFGKRLVLKVLYWFCIFLICKWNIFFFGLFILYEIERRRFLFRVGYRNNFLW